MKQLPVWQHRADILSALRDHQVIVVESPTGSGKTTQIPLILREAGYGRKGSIGITQPRRIATLSVCDFIKRQIGDGEGEYVGYKMRFSDTTTPATRIKIMTDGILLMELKSDPILSDYEVIVVDEAHERSLNIDFILGLLRNIVSVRPDFKVIISSATINTSVFSTFFDGAPIISIKSRVFPVSVLYRPPKRGTPGDEMIDSICDIVDERTGEGDILVFLPGEYDIVRAVNVLYLRDWKRKLVIYPLYARLSKEDQESVFTATPEGKTKVVVATNIAETSVTIDGITTVIDSGIAKVNFYNQKNFTSSLVPLPISRSSAEQRKGRAGRTQSGVCYRLYTEKDFRGRPLYSTEEILRTDLSEVVLRMSDLGIYDYERFPFITRPKREAIVSAEETLRSIDAIDGDRHLTATGEMMCKFPLLPRHSRVITESLLRHPDVLEQVTIAVAFLSSRTPFLFPAGEEYEARAAQHTFSDPYGDFVTYLRIYESYVKNETTAARKQWCKRYYFDWQGMQEIVHVTKQIGEICGSLGFPLSHGGTPKEYLICIARGLAQYVCVRAAANTYRSLTAQMIFIHPGSAYFRTPPRYIIAGEIVETSRMYARSVSPLKPEWLDEMESGLKKKLDCLTAGKPRKSDGKGRERSPLPLEEKKTAEVAQIYGKTYPVIARGGKKSATVAVIPLEDLSYLASRAAKAAKRPRAFRATLLWKGYYIHLGDTFTALLDLDGKLKCDAPLYDAPPTGTFTYDETLTLLFSLLERVLCFCKPKKRGKELQFIMLENSGNNYRFSSRKNFFEALDGSLYALGELKDMLSAMRADKKEQMVVRKTISRLIKLSAQ